MIITNEWLKEKSACLEAVDWFKSKKFVTDKELFESLISKNKLDWANWGIARIMKRKQYLAYAIYSAEQVIGIYEREYPDDKRPRNAINLAKRVFENDTEKNRAAGGVASEAASWAAGGAACAATRAASAAGGAACAAACAAGGAACAAARAASEAACAATSWAAGGVASEAARAASAAAYAAARAASEVAVAASDEMKLRILKYGFKLLGWEEKGNEKDFFKKRASRSFQQNKR